jgi:hypothetical protein
MQARGAAITDLAGQCDPPNWVPGTTVYLHSSSGPTYPETAGSGTSSRRQILTQLTLCETCIATVRAVPYCGVGNEQAYYLIQWNGQQDQ